MSENKRLFVGRKKVEDRFTIILDYDDEIGVKENRSGDVVVLKHNDLNAQQFVAQLVLFLNDQNQAIVDLYDGCEYWFDKASERITLLEKENEQLKSTNMEMEDYLLRLEEENKDKPFFKIVDDYLIEYDGDYFNLHKPSDIRSLIYLVNRSMGYNELQCEYNGDSE